MSGPYTQVDREAKNDAKRASKKAIRAFVNQYLRFPPVTDEDRYYFHFIKFYVSF
jgi:hypothetical protein